MASESIAYPNNNLVKLASASVTANVFELFALAVVVHCQLLHLVYEGPIDQQWIASFALALGCYSMPVFALLGVYHTLFYETFLAKRRSAGEIALFTAMPYLLLYGLAFLFLPAYVTPAIRGVWLSLTGTWWTLELSCLVMLLALTASLFTQFALWCRLKPR